MNYLARILKAYKKRISRFRQKYFARRSDNFTEKLICFNNYQDLAVIILMPGSLHLGLLALSHVKEYQNVLCISNGLADWERDILKKENSGIVINLSSTLGHSEIIDNLLAALNKPFWLIDHDCYILDINILHRQRQILGGHVGIAVYDTSYLNDGIVVPETFLILLDPAAIRSLQERYGVTSRMYYWDTLPEKAKAKLNSIGINQDRRPEAHKQYFDTLRVIALLADAEGHGFRMDFGYSAICQPYPELIHIGNTSKPIWPPVSRYSALGSFFWQRCLERVQSNKIREEYRKIWPNIRDSTAILAYLTASDLLIDGDSPELIGYLDQIIEKLDDGPMSV